MSEFAKIALRNSIKKIRLNVSVQDRLSSSEQICSNINKLDQYRRAERIGLYHAAYGEIDLSALWSSALQSGKSCYFPALQENYSLIFLPAQLKTSFKKNRFGIFEPDVPRALAIPVENLDLIVLPLLAFDDHGTRLGMGAGYYDRTLKGINETLLVGVAYPFQKVDYIENNPWDVALDIAITPTEVYDFSS